jgi:PilZ domain
MSLPSDLQDRRMFRRYPCDLPVACRPYPGAGDAWSGGRITDLSCVGMRLVAECCFAEGTLLLIQLKGAPIHMPASYLGKVLHSRASGDGGWLVGCQSVAILDEEKVAELLKAVQ